VIPDHDYRVKLNPNNGEAQFWRRGDSASLAVGQGDVLVTPLQLANAYATFANGGTVFAPHVGQGVYDRAGQQIRKVEPKVVRRTELAASLRDPLLNGFRGAVADPKGTAFGAFAGFPLAAFPVAGKTGTAEAPPKQDTSLFTAFAPADNARYVVTVVLEEAGLGASAAAPVARRVLEGIAAREGVAVAPPAPVNRVVGAD
jgi:penicillin-binding protein 2